MSAPYDQTPCLDHDQTTQILSRTAVGAGVAYAVPKLRGAGGAVNKFTWQTIITGAPTAVSTTLQGSDDGTNWTTLDTSTSTAGEARAIANVPVKFMRGNLGTLTGGTAPSVTVIVQPGG